MHVRRVSASLLYSCALALLLLPAAGAHSSWLLASLLSLAACLVVSDAAPSSSAARGLTFSLLAVCVCASLGLALSPSLILSLLLASSAHSALYARYCSLRTPSSSSSLLRATRSRVPRFLSSLPSSLLRSLLWGPLCVLSSHALLLLLEPFPLDPRVPVARVVLSFILSSSLWLSSDSLLRIFSLEVSSVLDAELFDVREPASTLALLALSLPSVRASQRDRKRRLYVSHFPTRWEPLLLDCCEMLRFEACRVSLWHFANLNVLGQQWQGVWEWTREEVACMPRAPGRGLPPLIRRALGYTSGAYQRRLAYARLDQSVWLLRAVVNYTVDSVGLDRLGCVTDAHSVERLFVGLLSLHVALHRYLQVMSGTSDPAAIGRLPAAPPVLPPAEWRGVLLEGRRDSAHILEVQRMPEVQRAHHFAPREPLRLYNETQHALGRLMSVFGKHLDSMVIESPHIGVLQHMFRQLEESDQS